MSAQPVIEVRWLWRRIYSFTVTLMNGAAVTGVVWRIDDPEVLKWLGLGLIGANVVIATLYLAGATVTDWAKLAAGARGAAS